MQFEKAVKETFLLVTGYLLSKYLSASDLLIAASILVSKLIDI